ncbi:MAG: hypothetical protein WD965_02920 [Actinomycetota bacterium]
MERRRSAVGSTPSRFLPEDDDTVGKRSAIPSVIEYVLVPEKVMRVLFAVVTVLVLLSTAGQASVYYLPDFVLRDSMAGLLYVNEERSLPTLYSSLMLLLSALLLGVIARERRRNGGPYVRHWQVLSLTFIYLSVDEFAALHEQAIDPVRRLLDIEGGPLLHAWVVPGAIGVAVFGVAFARFVRHLPLIVRQRVVLASVLFVGGAIGVEILGSLHAASSGQQNMRYAAIVTVEETLEMVGVAVFVSALLAYIAIVLPGVEWRIRVRTTRA